MTSRPKYLSHSAYSQFLRCGLQYKYERIDKVPAPPAWYFIGGRAVHLATERMDAAGTWPYAADQLKEFWEAAFDQELNTVTITGTIEVSSLLRPGRTGAHHPPGTSRSLGLR